MQHARGLCERATAKSQPCFVRLALTQNQRLETNTSNKAETAFADSGKSLFHNVKQHAR